MTSAQDFVEAARSYMDVRWHHLGRSREGVDCIGLLLLAAQDCGLEHDATPGDYKRGTKGFDMFDVLTRVGDPVSLADTRDGDLLVFSDGYFPGHMGIRSTRYGLPYVVHAHLKRRKVVEEPLTHDLWNMLRRAYRPFAFAAKEFVS